MEIRRLARREKELKGRKRSGEKVGFKHAIEKGPFVC